LKNGYIFVVVDLGVSVFNNYKLVFEIISTKIKG